MSEILLHTKLRELEEEVKVEKEVRMRYEKELSNLRLDFADLDAQFQEALVAKDKELETGKRLRQEIADLKQKIDSSNSENEEATLLLKRKHQEQMAELSAHMDQLSKAKFKYEKENKSFLLQLEDLRKENESLARAKNQAQLSCKDLETRQIESTQRIDDLLKQLNEVNELKNRLSKEHSEYYRKNSSLEFENQQLSLNNKRMNVELDDARMQLENEILVRNSLESKAKNLQIDLDNAQAQLEEETEARMELNKNYIRLQDEFKVNKDKVEKECEARIEDVEDSKRKLNSRFLELQDQFNEIMNKLTSSEKNKLRLQNQVDTLSTELEIAKKRADESSKREKNLEKENEELRSKLSIANAELDAAYQASRNHQSELSKYKHLSQQMSEQLDTMQKDKRRISEELETNTNQLLESQSRLNELERKLKALDADRQQLQNELEDTRDALQIETQKSQNLLAQMEKFKTDTEKKLADKDDEIDLQRSSHRRQLESAQSQLEESETRHKSDLNAHKKKFQAELDDLRSKYEGAKKAKADSDTQMKKLQQSNKELLDRLTEEQHMHDATRDQLSSAEKRATSYRADMEECKSLLERCDKAKKALELEYHDLEDKLNELHTSCNRALAEKKKFESDAISASDELHEAKFELKNAEEKIRNLNASLLKKEEEIRHEKELASELDASRKAMEQQLKDTQVRIEEAEEFAKREAKRLNAKLESRLVQLETELDMEKAKEQELAKEMRRLEKRNKDLLDQIGEEQAKLISMTDAYDKIQEKMKKYKGQIEISEEQVAVNMSKCKRIQRELEDAEDRAESMARTFLRASSVNRTNENYDSDYGESEQTLAAPSTTPSYLRSSYLYSRPTSIDEYSTSQANTGKSSTINSWRNKYKTVDIDDDDLLIQPRFSKYSSFAYPVKNKLWSSGYGTSGRNDRARSVAHIYDPELAYNNINHLKQHANKSSLYASRSSVSRMYDDLDEQPAANSRQTVGVKNAVNSFYRKSQTPQPMPQSVDLE